MKQKTELSSRRIFLKKMALMGGAGALLTNAAGTPRSGMGRGSRMNPDPHPPRGYRLTPHIRKYYDRAAF